MLKKIQGWLIRELKHLGVLLSVGGVALLFYGIAQVERFAGSVASAEVYVTAAIPGILLFLTGLIATTVGLTAEAVARIEAKLSSPHTLHQDTTKKPNSVKIPAPMATNGVNHVEQFDGRQIEQTEGRYVVGEKTFDSIIDARNAISKGEV